MPRKMRVEYLGAIYHVMSRGGSSRVQQEGLNSPFSDNTGINTVDLCDNGL